MQFQPPASHFVDGAPLEDATDGTPFGVDHPATGETIARLHAATPAVIDAALASATRAQTVWAAMTGTERGRYCGAPPTSCAPATASCRCSRRTTPASRFRRR